MAFVRSQYHEPLLSEEREPCPVNSVDFLSNNCCHVPISMSCAGIHTHHQIRSVNVSKRGGDGRCHPGPINVDCGEAFLWNYKMLYLFA